MSNSQWGPPGGQRPQQAVHYPQQDGQYPQHPPPPVAQYHAPPGGPQYGQPSWHPGPYGGPPGPNQQLPHGLGWGHQPMGGPRPPKRRNPVVVALVVLGVVGAGVVALAAVMAGVLQGATGISQPVTTYVPTSAPTYVPTGAPTASQSAGPSRRVTTSASTTRPTGPPLSIEATVARDGFYTSMRQRSIGCRERRVALNSANNLRTYYTNVMNCLNRAWAPQLRTGRDPITPPRVVFWTGYVQSPCSGGSRVSFYCSVSQTVYLKYDDDIRLWNRSSGSANRAFARMWVTYTAGHEYGHHLQHLTGILAAAHRLQYEAPDRRAALEVSRRIELQASCLATVFLGAHRSSYGITGLDLSVYRRYIEARTGDENNPTGTRSHGRRASHRYWAARGFGSLTSASCNTFIASASKVS